MIDTASPAMSLATRERAPQRTCAHERERRTGEIPRKPFASSDHLPPAEVGELEVSATIISDA
jgi:hypothetical protein